MPKVSKIRSGTTKPKEAASPTDERTDFWCCRCQKRYKKQKGNFCTSQSTLFRGNGGYLPICNNCMDELYDHYKSALGSEVEAIKRLCLKFDIYWNPDIYAILQRSSSGGSRIRAYVRNSNLYQYVGKTYDDTLDEEYREERERAKTIDGKYIASLNDLSSSGVEQDVEGDEAAKGSREVEVPLDVIEYWGPGFTADMYIDLEQRRKYWLSQYPEGTELTPGEDGLLRQICNMEISINQDRAAGKSIEKSVNALNSLFGSMNLKPSQDKEGSDSYIPFGVEIARFEDEEPIIDEDEEFEDVDHIGKNILSWFLGPLCETANIKNKYEKYFKDEVQKYTVERPHYDGDLVEDEEPIDQSAHEAEMADEQEEEESE